MAWNLVNVTRSNRDDTAACIASSVRGAHRAYGNASTLSLQIDDEAGTLTIAEEDEYYLADGGVKVFAGYVRQLGQTDKGLSSQRVYDLTFQDYNSRLDDDVVDNGFRSTAESDKARITWLFSTFGTHGISVGADVVQLRASMGIDQDFTGMTLHEALTEIAKVTGGSFYVDFNKVLHYYSSEVISAPFNLSDSPNYSTTFEYEDFSLPKDSVDKCNAVFVIGEGISGWRYLGGSPPAVGTRRAVCIRDDSVTTQAQLDAVGDAYIAENSGSRLLGSLVTYRAGLIAGMTVQITHAGWGITAQSFRIASISFQPETKDRIRYEVNFGGKPVTVDEFFGRVQDQVTGLAQGLTSLSDQAVTLVDLSIGGGNLVPNSSFEDQSSWSPGAQWVVGHTPTGGQLAFQGTKTARIALSAQTAGDLLSPFINVVRTDDYWFSVWRFVRSRSAGTARVFINEYNSSSTLVASNVVDVTAADSDWTRVKLHFANTAGPGVIGWNAATVKVRVGASSAGASATLTMDVDGFQLERGNAITAYAPAPYEITAASIGTTQIADDAITTAKIAAAQVVAAKIAAGTITGSLIAGSTITTDKLVVGGSGSIQIDATGIYVNDPAGTQGVITAAGFSGSFDDWLKAGVYNNTFAFGTTGTLTNGDTRIAYWSVAKTGSTGWTTAYEADTGVASGRRIRVTATSSGASTNELILTQFIPVTNEHDRDLASRLFTGLYGEVITAPGTNDLRVAHTLQQFQKDKTTAIGAETSNPAAVSFGVGAFHQYAGIEITSPLTAYIRVRIRVWRGTATPDNWELYLYGLEAYRGSAMLPISGVAGMTPVILATSTGLAIYPGNSSIDFDESSDRWTFLQNARRLIFPDLISGLDNATDQRIETVGADFRAASGCLITRSTTGTPSDTVMVGGGLNGGLVVDITNHRFWVRDGAANWRWVAVAGERIPADEYRCPECLVPIGLDQEVVCVVNEAGDPDDPHTRHMLWKHRDCGLGWRLLKALGLVRSRLPWYTKVLHDEYAVRTALDDRLEDAPRLKSVA